MPVEVKQTAATKWQAEVRNLQKSGEMPTPVHNGSGIPSTWHPVMVGLCWRCQKKSVRRGDELGLCDACKDYLQEDG